MLFAQIKESVLAGVNPKEICDKVKADMAAKKVPDRAFSISEMLDCVKMPDGRSALSWIKGRVHAQAGNYRVLQETITTSLFTSLMTDKLSGLINEGYAEVEDVASQLVTPYNATMDTERINGINQEDNIKEVPEGGDYSHATNWDETSVTAATRKFGEIIEITRETALFDKTGMIMDRARRLGQAMQRHRQKRIIEKVTDKNSTTLYKNGTATTLFNTTAWSENTWPCLTAILSNGLSKYEEALNAVYNNFNGKRDLKGTRISVVSTGPILLCAANDEAKAWSLKNTISTPDNSKNMVQMYGPGAPRNDFKVLSSPYLTDTTDGNWDAGDWWFGWPQRQFREFIWWDTEVLTQSETSDAAFERDLLYRYKVSRSYDVYATDYLFWVKNRALSAI